MNRNMVLAVAAGAAVVGAAFAVGIVFSGDGEAGSALSDTDAPVVTVFKSPA